MIRSASVVLMGPGSLNDHTFVVSNITNLGRVFEKGVKLADAQITGTVRFDYRAQILTNLSVNAFAAAYDGKNGEFRYRFVPPPELVKLVPSLAEYQMPPAQTFQLGAGLSLSI